MKNSMYIFVLLNLHTMYQINKKHFLISKRGQRFTLFRKKIRRVVENINPMNFANTYFPSDDQYHQNRLRVEQTSWQEGHRDTVLGYRPVPHCNSFCWSIWCWCIRDLLSLRCHISCFCNTCRRILSAFGPHQPSWTPRTEFLLWGWHRALLSPGDTSYGRPGWAGCRWRLDALYYWMKKTKEKLFTCEIRKKCYCSSERLREDRKCRFTIF